MFSKAWGVKEIDPGGRRIIIESAIDSPPHIEEYNQDVCMPFAFSGAGRFLLVKKEQQLEKNRKHSERITPPIPIRDFRLFWV